MEILGDRSSHRTYGQRPLDNLYFGSFASKTPIGGMSLCVGSCLSLREGHKVDQQDGLACSRDAFGTSTSLVGVTLSTHLQPAAPYIDIGVVVLVSGNLRLSLDLTWCPKKNRSIKKSSMTGGGV